MNITLRAITPADRRHVEWAVKQAFWNVNCPGCDEHYLTHCLWEDPAYLPELSLLAEAEGEVIGAILYARAALHTPDGPIPTLLFGPLAVIPAYQRQGVGGQLLTRSMALAREAGWGHIFITGVPAYYPRFGFRTADTFGVAMPDGSNFDAFMGIELMPGALRGLGGTFHEPPVFDMCDLHNPAYRAKVEAFDQSFPHLEKRVLPHQWR